MDFRFAAFKPESENIFVHVCEDDAVRMMSAQDALKLKRLRKQLKKDRQKAKKKLMHNQPSAQKIPTANRGDEIDQGAEIGSRLSNQVGSSNPVAVKKSQSRTSPPLDSQPGQNSSWNFKVDYNDHFETPLIAYQDISVILSTIAARIGKDLKDLVLYDPYYCKGRMIHHLNSLGYMSIINRNRDFYKDIANNKVPGKIILLCE
jgi:hypothetical protein